MTRLRYSSREIERAAHLVRIHMDIPPPEAGDAALRRWVRRVGEENVWDLYRVHLADWRGNRLRGNPAPLIAIYRRVRRILREAHALRREDLAIGGRELLELGFERGPALGAALERLLQRVVDDPSLNTRERLLALAREMAPLAEAGRDR